MGTSTSSSSSSSSSTSSPSSSVSSLSFPPSKYTNGPCLTSSSSSGEVNQGCLNMSSAELRSRGRITSIGRRNSANALASDAGNLYFSISTSSRAQNSSFVIFFSFPFPLKNSEERFPPKANALGQ